MVVTFLVPAGFRSRKATTATTARATRPTNTTFTFRSPDELGVDGGGGGGAGGTAPAGAAPAEAATAGAASVSDESAAGRGGGANVPATAGTSRARVACRRSVTAPGRGHRDPRPSEPPRAPGPGRRRRLGGSAEPVGALPVKRAAGSVARPRMVIKQTRARRHVGGRPWRGRRALPARGTAMVSVAVAAVPERSATGEELRGSCCQRVRVAGRTGLLAARLLGRHVRRCPEHPAVARGERAAGPDDSRPGRSPTP